MKHSTFARILCWILVLAMVLPHAVTGASAAEEIATTIRHTQTEGESNYFTYSSTGWSAMGQSAAHVWSDDPVAASSFGLLFLHRSESAALGICKMITGKPELISSFPWPFVDTMIYSLPLSILALIVVSFCTRPPSRRVVVKCFHYYK